MFDCIVHFIHSVIFQHGNRLARLQDYAASQKALRISLTATDTCLESIRKDRITQGGEKQVQEQEMLVLSKQIFHILSYVWRQVRKFDEANKCLDRIEAYIDEQRIRDDDLYDKTMARLVDRDQGSGSIYARRVSSTFALEGKSKYTNSNVDAA